MILKSNIQYQILEICLEKNHLQLAINFHPVKKILLRYTIMIFNMRLECLISKIVRGIYCLLKGWTTPDFAGKERGRQDGGRPQTFVIIVPLLIHKRKKKIEEITVLNLINK